MGVWMNHCVLVWVGMGVWMNHCVLYVGIIVWWYGCVDE